MFKLSAGNVLLKPSHRRQLMNGLKRALRLSERLGDRMISITMHRSGRLIEMKADVADRRGVVGFRARQHDLARRCPRTRADAHHPSARSDAAPVAGLIDHSC